MSPSLTAYKQVLDEEIERYCHVVLSNTERDFGAASHNAMHAFCSLLKRGGKRLRGALVMSSYAMFGGTDKRISIKAGRIIEMVHAYLLIIDDISDRSATRRGGPTAHVQLADYHRRHHLHGANSHFGEAIATDSALAGLHIALAELGELPVDEHIRLRALNNLNHHLLLTTHGQINDIFNEAVRTIDEAAVRQTLSLKTAYYSFLNPLELGAILASADAPAFARLKAYALPLGLAFQVIDDILGTFGNEFELGKSAQDDLREGKITLMIAYALDKATPAQRKRLLSTIGNDKLTADDLMACKQIIKATGALDDATCFAHTQVRQAIEALGNAPDSWHKPQLTFLRKLAEYVLERKV